MHAKWRIARTGLATACVVSISLVSMMPPLARYSNSIYWSYLHVALGFCLNNWRIEKSSGNASRWLSMWVLRVVCKVVPQIERGSSPCLMVLNVISFAKACSNTAQGVGNGFVLQLSSLADVYGSISCEAESTGGSHQYLSCQLKPMVSTHQ